MQQTGVIALILISILSGSFASAATPVPAKGSAVDHWDLTPIYADQAAWEADLAKIKAEVPNLKKCQGHLGDSAENLKSCLDQLFNLRKRISRAEVWAELKKSADVTDAKNMENGSIFDDLVSSVDQQIAFFSPELTALGRNKIESLEKKDLLTPYHQYLRVIMDHADHILDTSSEVLLSSVSPLFHVGGEVHNLLMSSDIVWKSVKMSDGKIHHIDQQEYEKFRESANRSDRIKAFNAFYEVLSQYERTFGFTLSSAVKRNVIMAKIEKYPNALTAALSSDQIPEGVYRTLIEQVNAGLPVYHSYLNLMKKRMNLSQMEYVDAYAPGSSFDVKYPLDKSKKIVLEAVAPLGSEYQKKLASAFEERWMDVYPAKGKSGGAFMNPAAFDVHPYVSLNHLDDFSSASTLAHEWGHAMHSVYSGANQPYQYSDYATFIAEIASTTNEVLLHEYLIKNSKSKQEKAFYLESLLKLIRTTFFRQAQFGEFELRLHEELEKGGALPGQKISSIYGEIARRYYGDKEGVMKVDPKYFSEWAFVPHFYSGFYVYQYATSISAAFYFAENILNGTPGAQENYLNVLKSGSSQYPYEILLKAGVDMKSPKVYQAIVERMRKAVEELKAL